MPVNTGWIESYCSIGDQGAGVTLRVRYRGDPEGQAWDPPNQAIINDPVLGYALGATNTATTPATVVVTGPDKVPHTFTIPPGLTTLTAAQLGAVGVTNRANATVSLSNG